MEQTYIYVNKKKNHKYVQALFNTPVITHKVIMNKFNGEEIALVESKGRGLWFVVHLAGDVAQEFDRDELAATNAFYAWRGVKPVVKKIVEKKPVVKGNFSNLSNQELVNRINRRFNNKQNDDDEVFELFRRRDEQGFKVVSKFDTYELEE